MRAFNPLECTGLALVLGSYLIEWTVRGLSAVPLAPDDQPGDDRPLVRRGAADRRRSLRDRLARRASRVDGKPRVPDRPLR